SFLENPDPDLGSKLLGEASGILNWALDGLDRLRENGFTKPAKHEELQEDFKEAGSPMLAFYRDCCRDVKGSSEFLENLWMVYVRWCQRTGKYSLGYENFCGKFSSAFPHLQKTRPRKTAGKKRMLTGVRIMDWLGDVEESPKVKAILGGMVEPAGPVVPVKENSIPHISQPGNIQRISIEGTGTT